MERHLEKNAGSTFREVIMHAERRGKCMYWGFQQRSPAWQAAIAALRNLTAQDIPPRLCIEAHSGIDYGVPWLERFAQLRGLRKVFAERGIDIPLHFHVRFRSPLSHYVSYYLWTVVERQTRNPKKFGSSFADWARSVPNLQSELFLSSKAAFTASFAPKDHKEIKEWRQRWAVPAKAAARRRLVWELLNEYDLLGTTDQFEESSLVVARALNWSVHDMAAPDHLLKQTPNAGDSCASARAAARSAVKRHWLGKPWPWWCRNPTLDYNAEKARVHSRVCPNRTACEELIRQVAPLDHELYARARQWLRGTIAAAGPGFSAQLSEMRKASKRACAECTACSWRPQRSLGRLPRDSERNGRRSIFALAPNFSKPRTCVRGNQRVMEIVWSEHVQGGKVACLTCGRSPGALTYGRMLGMSQAALGFGLGLG